MKENSISALRLTDFAALRISRIRDAPKLQFVLCSLFVAASLLFGVVVKAQPHSTPLTPLEQTVQSLYSRLDRSTVFILAKDGTMLGSGVVIQTDGLILTHGHHKKLPGDTVNIVFPDGRKVSGKYRG